MSKIHEEGICPVCGCSDLNYWGRNIDSDTMTYDWDCPDCKSDGMEVYNIQFSEHDILTKGKKKKQ